VHPWNLKPSTRRGRHGSTSWYNGNAKLCSTGKVIWKYDAKIPLVSTFFGITFEPRRSRPRYISQKLCYAEIRLTVHFIFITLKICKKYHHIHFSKFNFSWSKFWYRPIWKTWVVRKAASQCRELGYTWFSAQLVLLRSGFSNRFRQFSFLFLAILTWFLYGWPLAFTWQIFGICFEGTRTM